MNANAIARRISMIETTLTNDADVLTPDQKRSLTVTLNGLKAVRDGAVTVNEVATAAAKIEEVAEVSRDENKAMIVESAVAMREVVAVATEVESPKVAAENAKRVASGRPKMTADEAKQFDVYSEKNAEIAESSCENGCVAYEDIFTYNRWIALGMQVQKGEKSTRIEVPIFRIVVDEVTGKERKVKTGSRMVPVFCRCQVKKIAKSAKRAA